MKESFVYNFGIRDSISGMVGIMGYSVWTADTIAELELRDGIYWSLLGLLF